MTSLNDEVLDQGLDWLDANGTRLDICSQEPTNYTEATSTYTLGNDTINTGAPQDGDTDGRKVVVPAVSGASVTASGTASHVAVTDGTSVLCLAEALSASQAVTSGNTFNTAAFDVTLRDPS